MSSQWGPCIIKSTLHGLHGCAAKSQAWTEMIWNAEICLLKSSIVKISITSCHVNDLYIMCTTHAKCLKWHKNHCQPIISLVCNNNHNNQSQQSQENTHTFAGQYRQITLIITIIHNHKYLWMAWQQLSLSYLFCQGLCLSTRSGIIY